MMCPLALVREEGLNTEVLVSVSLLLSFDLIIVLLFSIYIFFRSEAVYVSANRLINQTNHILYMFRLATSP